MVLLGKALSGGFYPISAVLCDRKIMEVIRPGEHGSTYGGNPLAARTAMTALDVIMDEKLCDNSLKLGKMLQGGLSEIIDKKIIKEIRGKGLFVGV
jgi:ornithine--oxo-acid transaminase